MRKRRVGSHENLHPEVAMESQRCTQASAQGAIRQGGKGREKVEGEIQMTDLIVSHLLKILSASVDATKGHDHEPDRRTQDQAAGRGKRRT